MTPMDHDEVIALLGEHAIKEIEDAHFRFWCHVRDLGDPKSLQAGMELIFDLLTIQIASSAHDSAAARNLAEFYGERLKVFVKLMVEKRIARAASQAVQK